VTSRFGHAALLRQLAQWYGGAEGAATEQSYAAMFLRGRVPYVGSLCARRDADTKLQSVVRSGCM